MNLGIIITLVAIAATMYATISVYLMFHYGRDHIYDPNPYSFWGSLSFQRKYFRNPHSTTHMYLTEPAPDSGWKKWYYKAFGIKYKERFFGSATFLVFTTDAFHLMQWILGNTVCLLVVAGIDSTAGYGELDWRRLKYFILA